MPDSLKRIWVGFRQSLNHIFNSQLLPPWSHNAFDKAHLFHFLLRPQLELDKMGLGKRLYFQQSLYQEILKKGEKSCGGHLREKTCENGDHAVVSSVGYRVFETRIASRVRTTDVKHTGCPKKMSHSDFSLKSVPEVRLYFFTCVSESEFRARSN